MKNFNKVVLLAVMLLATVTMVVGCGLNSNDVNCTLGEYSGKTRIENDWVRFAITLDEETDLDWSIDFDGVSSGYYDVEFVDKDGTVLDGGKSAPGTNVLPAGKYFLKVRVDPAYYDRYGEIKVKFDAREASAE